MLFNTIKTKASQWIPSSATFIRLTLTGFITIHLNVFYHLLLNLSGGLFTTRLNMHNYDDHECQVRRDLREEDIVAHSKLQCLPTSAEANACRLHRGAESSTSALYPENHGQILGLKIGYLTEISYFSVSQDEMLQVYFKLGHNREDDCLSETLLEINRHFRGPSFGW